MSIWPMMDKLEALSGTRNVPYGNTIRLSLGEIWCQYSVGKNEDPNITIGSTADDQINLETIERLNAAQLNAAIFLLQFARDEIEAHGTVVKVNIRWWYEDN